MSNELSVLGQIPEDILKATRKNLPSDHPTWCPGCGDFSVLNAYFKLNERRGMMKQNITTISGIGCSSRFPYFVNAHGAHFVHGRALSFATGLSISRPDLHVFVFIGDGDAFSIGGNHLTHTARKNVKMTCVIMDNHVYGLTKKQTSPTSPLGFKSKTDPWGAEDMPIHPIKQLVSAGATFVARTHAAMPEHLLQMMERAMDHNGFSVVEVLSECTEFNRGSFDTALARKGGQFRILEEKKNDGTPEDGKRHDVTDEISALRLANEPWPGCFGVFYQIQRPTKNENEAKHAENAMNKGVAASEIDRLQEMFNVMK
ncbi:MAG: pyruvate ferredoxin oxidoreductase [Candidatus Omnitrophica bacterium]|nr:pyruvate ferredoxin oxidoreductase [Candidatus Omnitrophota bacterium]